MFFVSGGEEVSLLSGLLEPFKELTVGNLAVAVLVELLESLFEGSVVKRLVATDLSVELLSDLLDLFSLEEAGLVPIEGIEKFAHHFFKLLNCD